MNTKTLLAAALAAGSLIGVASVAQAAPAVVADTPYAPAPTYVAPPATYVAPPGTTTTTTTRITTYSEPAVVVHRAPPAPIYEAVPAPREGYVWAPGHYLWENGRYVWRGGEWMASRPGYSWQAARWERRDDGSWYLVGGTWVRGDRVAVYERDRHGPYGDRDGDGVINRDDRYPRDPARY
jgi:hypothetical protein